MRAVLLLLTVHFGLFIYLAISGVALNLDGSRILFAMLNEQSVHWSIHHLRLVEGIFQAPGVAVLNAFPLGTVDQLAVNLTSIAYMTHPFLSLLICYLILRTRGLEKFLFLPILSFALLQHTIILFPVSHASDTVSIFWPTYFAILYLKESKRSFVLICGFLSFLAFSYELAIFFFIPLLALLAIHRSRHSSNKKFWLLVLIVLGLATLPALYTLLVSLPQGTLGPRTSAILVWPNTHRIIFYGVAMAVLCFFASIARGYKKDFLSNRTLLVIFFPILLVTAYLCINDPNEIHFDAFKARVWLLPCVCLLGLAFYLWAQDHTENQNKFFWKICGASLVLSFLTTLSGGLLFIQGLNNVRDYQSKNPGCNFIGDHEYFNQEFGQFGLIGAFLPHQSLLVQRSRHLQSIIFTDLSELNKGDWKASTNPCENFSERWRAFILSKRTGGNSVRDHNALFLASFHHEALLDKWRLKSTSQP